MPFGRAGDGEINIAPIESVAGESIPPGDATALAHRYVDRLGVAALYIADLDAIERRAPQHAVVRTIASVGVPVWLDAGITSSDDARQAMECGASRLIVGLETLSSFEVLESIVKAVGRERVVFSLDLRDGQPIATTSELAQQSPEDLAARAAAAGVGAMIDARPCASGFRLGSRSGTASHGIRAAVSPFRCTPEAVFAVWTTSSDCEEGGCDGALVATALLDGQITKRDLELLVAT